MTLELATQADIAEIKQELAQIKQLLKNPSRDKRYYTSKDLTKLFNVKPSTLQSYRDSGKLKFTKLSERNFLYPVEDVERLLLQKAV